MVLVKKLILCATPGPTVTTPTVDSDTDAFASLGSTEIHTIPMDVWVTYNDLIPFFLIFLLLLIDG